MEWKAIDRTSTGEGVGAAFQFITNQPILSSGRYKKINEQKGMLPLTRQLRKYLQRYISGKVHSS